ncbi:kinase [Terricaulis sp.]|uniref:kinase n=1 Tax=Terricaulis sp. TaxID=2768686 RepID=UPI0037843E5D
MSVGPFAIPTLIFNIIQAVRAREPSRPALVGVAGAQGSGKTHWCSLLEAANRPRFAHFSLDDVYLTKAERERLAAKLHPLFAVRGPPGTHDLDLAYATITALEEAKPGVETTLPRFDKASDDRAPRDTWPVYTGWPEAILFDGWCVGATHVEGAAEAPPLNALEAAQDADGEWRRYVEGALTTDYLSFFRGFDAIVYLRPPSWEVVRRWRGEQEEQLLGRALSADENAKLDRFVMHYERLTRSMMAGHHMAKWIVHLDEARNIVRIEER